MKLKVAAQVTIFQEREVEVNGDTKLELIDNAREAFREELEKECGWVDFDSFCVYGLQNEDNEGEWY